MGPPGTARPTWTCGRCSPGRWVSAALPDMFQPVLVPVHLTPDGGEVDLLDLPRHRSRLTAADDPVVDGADGDHLGRRAGEESLVGRVEVRPQDVGRLDLPAQVPGDGGHRRLGYPLEGPRSHGRGEEPALPHDEEVLARALADVALRAQEDGLVVAGLQRLHL